MQETLNILLTSLGTILTALITWGTTELVKLIRGKVKNEKIARCLCGITEIISSTVDATTQTYVKALKQEKAFTKEKQKEALQKSLDIAKAQLNKETKVFIEENYGDLDTFLTTQIEAFIFKTKNRQ